VGAQYSAGWCNGSTAASGVVSLGSNPSPAASVRGPREHMFVVRREDVLRLYAAGLTQRQIAAQLGVTPPTISYHMRRLGFPAQRQLRQDWPEIQAYYDEGNSLRECQARFRFSTASWYEAVQRGAIVPRPAGMSVEKLISGRRNRTHLKQRLVRLGLLENACRDCGITEWRGRAVIALPAPRQWDQRRQPDREPRPSLPKLPQPDGQLRRSQPWIGGGGVRRAVSENSQEPGLGCRPCGRRR
jgi:hypothetical protein